MRYPLVILPYEIKKILFTDIYPSYLSIKKPEPPIIKEHDSHNKDLILDGITILGVILTIATIVDLNDGKGSIGIIFVCLVLTAFFYFAGATSKREKKDSEEKNKKAKMYYDEDLSRYSKEKAHFDFLKSVQNNPSKDLEYRHKLVLDYLTKTSSQRKYRNLDHLETKELKLTDIRNTIRSKFISIANISRITKNDGTFYIPLLCLNLPNTKINIIVDIDNPKLVYSSTEYLDTLLLADVDVWSILDDRFDDHLQKKFYDDMNNLNSEYVKNGFIVIKFTQDQMHKSIDTCIATILNILLYLNFYTSTFISESIYYNNIDLSNTYDFRNNIFTYS